MTTQSDIERNKATIHNLIDQVINSGRLDLCDLYLAATAWITCDRIIEQSRWRDVLRAPASTCS